MKTKIFILGCIAAFLSSCAVIRPGDVGIKQNLGKLKGKTKTQGVMLFNPFTSSIVRVPIRTVNKEIRLNLPSKEGLNVQAEISILYHIEEAKVAEIISTVGKRYEQTLILSTFRSASADVCARFFAKDMHSGKRGEIEKEIKVQMAKLLEGRGFVIEAVLLKSITLPKGLYAAIEAKLQAEQEAQQMKFVLQREEKEAERKRIEAAGIRDAQLIIKEGITEGNIQWKSLEVLKEISMSPNAKLILTDGKTPVLIGGDKD
jgi:regulator of protease activity HflC (stomatin/prohibitin superfamily)|tara:strand:- start:187 stop:966 length:780 start_codon:yes stop_codon:yes gene_type:complete